MKLGLIGLGKMGGNMAERLIKNGHQVVGFDLSEVNLEHAEKNGVARSGSLKELVSKLDKPRAVWVMVPHGKPTEDTVSELIGLLDEDDTIIDGGNSHYVNSVKNAALCKKKNIHFLDAGVSGGVWGLEEGYNIMIGGEEASFQRLEPIFKALTAEKGYALVGPNGSGHFVKMIHNALEYVMLQGIGEAFECMQRSEFDLDLKQIADLWNHGAVVRCWLLELLVSAFDEEGNSLKQIAAYIDDSETGRWTTDYAVMHAIPVPTITLSLYERFASRIEGQFSAKVIAALRNQFGGHPVKEADNA